MIEFISVKKKIFSYLLFAAMIWYFGLCVINYFYQRPLWNDEWAVSLTLDKFEPIDYFKKPLENEQNFPHLYLFFIHILSKPFNFSLLSVRFLPFIAMLSAFFIWMKIMRKEFKEDSHYLIYILCWLSSAALIYYSAELKQYSMDVLCAAVFTYFIYSQEKLEESKNKVKYALLLALMPGLITLSYTSFFFFIFPLYNLFLSFKKGKIKINYLFIYVFSLAIFSFFAWHFDMRLRLVRGYDDYFIYYSSIDVFFKTFGEGVINLFSRYLVERPRILKKIIVFFFTFGIMNLFGSFFAHIKKEKYYLKSVKTMALIIFIELFIMGSLKKYPFSVPRTSLFFSPIILYLTLSGIITIKKVNTYVFKIIFSSFIILLLFISFQLSHNILIGKIEFAPILWFFGF